MSHAPQSSADHDLGGLVWNPVKSHTPFCFFEAEPFIDIGKSIEISYTTFSCSKFCTEGRQTYSKCRSDCKLKACQAPTPLPKSKCAQIVWMCATSCDYGASNVLALNSENMQRQFTLAQFDGMIDGWATSEDDGSDVVRQTEVAEVEDSKVGWHSEQAIYSEKEWRRKYIKDVSEDPFNPYAIIAFGERGELTALGLRSQYLKDLYHAVADYIPGITVESDMIIFGQPFQPMFFYLEAMRTRSEETECSEEEEEDLITLVNFYDKLIKPSHDKIRTKIGDKSIDFNQLWALFKPGELIYSKDEWEKPQLFYACASAYRLGGREYGGNEEEDEDQEKVKRMTQYLSTLNLNQPKRFCFDCWNVRWDPSTKRFTRSLSTFKIVNFRGTRKITSLAYYPFSNYREEQPDEDELIAKLERRGHLWKTLVSGGPVPRNYDGAALELQIGLTASVRSSERVNVSSVLCECTSIF